MTGYASPASRSPRGPAPGRPRRPARAGRAPHARSPRRSARVRGRREGAAAEAGRNAAPMPTVQIRRAATGPVTPERFGLLQALLAYLLAACGESKRAVSRRRIVERFQIPAGGARGAPVAAQPRQLRRRLLRRLRRARRATRCTSTRSSTATCSGRTEADAARGARDPARAGVRRPDDRRRRAQPLDRVRKKLEDTFGQFELAQTPDAARGRRRGEARRARSAMRSASTGSSRSNT